MDSKSAQTPIHSPASTSSAITLRQFLTILYDYFKELVRNSLWIGLLCVGAFMLAKWYTADMKVKYLAKSSFMTNSDSGGSMSGIMQLAGQFGIGGGKNGVNADKLGELIGSQQMVFKTLLKKVEIEGQEDLLVNHYIKIFNKHDDWESEELRDLQFRPVVHQDSLSFAENKAILKIYDEMLAKYMHVNIGQSGIIRANFESNSPLFGKFFIEELIVTLRDFYVNKTVEQQKIAYEVISHRTDSIYNRLLGADHSLAEWLESNKKPLMARTIKADKKIKGEQIQRSAEILGVMYEEAVRQREIARMNMINNTPLIQVIDLPRLPLKERKPNKLSYYLMAILFGGLLGVSLVSLRKMIKDAFRNEPATDS